MKTPTLTQQVRILFNDNGYKKPIGNTSPREDLPHYFLHRNFMNEQDLLIIFNTKRCKYQCYFCSLPLKSSEKWISGTSIISQFLYVLNCVKHSLSVLERLTFSNEGSILDTSTFDSEALTLIISSTCEIRSLRRIVLETRLEFLKVSYLDMLKSSNPNIKFNILTGFETLDSHIRDNILYKRESLDTFLKGLDVIGSRGLELTAYVLFKPSPEMSDSDALFEANRTIDFLKTECDTRSIPLSIRLNPMYVAMNSRWAKKASNTKDYLAPRLTDVFSLAVQKRAQGIPIYIGLSTEGLSNPWGTYKSREDFSKDLLLEIIRFNHTGV